jgi:hypothetical protein
MRLIGDEVTPSLKGSAKVNIFKLLEILVNIDSDIFRASLASSTFSYYERLFGWCVLVFAGNMLEFRNFQI